MRPKYLQKKVHAFYGDDPREIPLYTLPQAAHYLKIPFVTLKSWVKGREYVVNKGHQLKFFKPVITLPSKNLPRLSFINLVESYVLNGIRRVENIPFYKVRQAVEYLKKNLPVQTSFS